jgi:uncharacterized protein (TIGR03437 family)
MITRPWSWKFGMSKLGMWKLGIAFFAATSVWAATFGTVVSIGGHASDIALDEGRGVLYVANFTGNTIDVISLAGNSIRNTIAVAPQPSSIAMSPNGRYLLVAHFGNFAPPAPSTNSLTLIDLNSNGKQTFALNNTPLGVAFGIDNKAFVVTSGDFRLFDPGTGSFQPIDTIAGSVAKTLPQAPATFPQTIKTASISASGDALHIYGFGDGVVFQYDVQSQKVAVLSGTLPPGPRVASINQDGSVWMASWYMVNGRSGRFIDQMPTIAGQFDIGSSAFDTPRGRIYAQIPENGSSPNSPPLLKILSSDNLALIDTIQLPENMTGRSILSSDGSKLYTVSDSGVLILPVGALDTQPKLVASQSDLVFRGNLCVQTPGTQSVTITDPSGGSTAFKITPAASGVLVSPTSGVTPATIRVTVDPNAFQNQKGSLVVPLRLSSARAINVPRDIRVIINSRDADQRGSFFNVPGNLTDVLADPARDRFYITRKDTNELLVFDANTYTLITRLRTRNTPVKMAITADARYLLVANFDSQLVSVFDLESLQESTPIQLNGFIAHSLAISQNAILAAGRDFQTKGKIVRLDLASRTSTQPDNLGIYKNDVSLTTALISSPDGSTILIAEADGNLMVYNAQEDTFSVSRKDTTSLAGAIAASNSGQYVVGNTLYNSSLVPLTRFETASGLSSGFSFIDQSAVRINAPSASTPGVIQRVNLQTGNTTRATRTIEAPVLGSTDFPFTRTLAPLSNRAGIVVLTTSGFTVLPWDYDSASAPPRIDRVVNAADFTKPIAPGGLITVFGGNMSPLSLKSLTSPVATSLADSCLQVNGISVPVLFVSPSQVNAQLPNIDGSTTIRLNTGSGSSDNFNLTISPTAPSIFRIATASNDSTPAIVRADNNQLTTFSNPVRHGDVLTIYLTGLGRTAPEVPIGNAAPSDQLSNAVVQPVVTLGGIRAEVQFAGLTPESVGLYQINIRVAGTVPAGDSVPLEITQGSGSTAVTVRVVE